MTKRRKQKNPAREIQEEMLRHLAANPPPADKTKDQPGSKRPSPSPARKPPAEPSRPRLMLRKMPLDLALTRLHSFLTARRALGTEELVVIVGKGHGSPDGIPILAPAVRDWLEQHPELVASFEDAPAHEGGSGALLVRLRPRA